jgi:hypothetical protein
MHVDRPVGFILYQLQELRRRLGRRNCLWLQRKIDVVKPGSLSVPLLGNFEVGSQIDDRLDPDCRELPVVVTLGLPAAVDVVVHLTKVFDVDARCA